MNVEDLTKRINELYHKSQSVGLTPDEKEEQARLRKKENDLKKTEAEIEALENRDAEIDELMAAPEICTDVAKLQELSKEKEQITEKLTALYEKWEELSED